MAIVSKLFEITKEYNYKIIFIAYLVLSICMVLLYVSALFWEDIKGFWIVLSPYVLGLPYYAYMWKKQASIKEKQE